MNRKLGLVWRKRIVPQKIYEKLVHESARRKIAGEPNHLMPALLREAVLQYLTEFDSLEPVPRQR